MLQNVRSPLQPPSSSDPLPLKGYLLKVPQPSRTALPAGIQMSKHMSFWLVFMVLEGLCELLEENRDRQYHPAVNLARGSNSLPRCLLVQWWHDNYRGSQRLSNLAFYMGSSDLNSGLHA